MKNCPEIIQYKNGLRVVFQNLEYTDICSINIKVVSASCWENAENSGISHFIEHMLFKGTKSRTAIEIAEETDEIGGISNAYTSRENTCLYVSSLSEHSEKAIDILCDMVVNPLMSPNDIETEKGVIIEEIEMYNDSPEDVCADAYDEIVWKKSSFSLKILGTYETVNSFNKTDLENWHSKYFTPERTVISVCGKFEKDRLLKVIDKYYGSQIGTDFYYKPIDAEFHSVIKTVKRDFNQNQLILGFPGINNYDKRKYSAVILATMLGASTSSKLFQRLREELGLVYNIDCFNTSYGRVATFSICAGFSSNDEDKVISEIKNVILEFNNNITQKDLSRAIEQSVSGFVMGLENSSSRAARNSTHILLNENIISEEDVINAYRSITLDDIKEISNLIFNFDKASLCITGKVKRKSHYIELIGGI